MATVYLNGEFLPLEQAVVPVMDRGFLFGDAVYEVIPVFGGHCLRLAQHLNRLAASLRAVRIAPPMDEVGLQRMLERLIVANGGGDQILYVQVTRGVAAAREHRFSPDMRPTLLAMSRPANAPSAEPPVAIAAVLEEDIRWHRCDIKTTALLGGVMLTQRAFDAGAAEALLVRDGRVWEGASSNLFAVLDGVLRTAPPGPQILPGITRDLVLELAQQQGLRCREEALTVADLARVSELWITSSTRELVPVTRLDGHPVGSGTVGPIFGSVWRWYQTFRQQVSSGAVAPPPAQE